jgi:hypothetical protein
MKTIKRSVLATLFLGLLFANSAKAQDEITDEQLRKYAVMQEVIDVMKKDISIEINVMIKAQEGINGKRYVEISKTKGDEAKLAALNATDLEKKFLKLTNDLKSKRTDAIKTVNSAMATKMLGEKGKVYKRIKEALSADDAVKTRYDAIVAVIKMKDGES